MSEPIRIEPTRIAFDVPVADFHDVSEMDQPSLLTRAIRGLERAPEITVAMRYEPYPLARLGEEKVCTLRAPRFKMGPRGLRVRFRGRVTAVATDSITVSSVEQFRALRFRDSKGWRRHVRREKAAKRRIA